MYAGTYLASLDLERLCLYFARALAFALGRLAIRLGVLHPQVIHATRGLGI